MRCPSLLGTPLVLQVLEKRQAIKDAFEEICFGRILAGGSQRSCRHMGRDRRRHGNNHGATNAGSRPHWPHPIISALASASVENSAITDLVSAKSMLAFLHLIANTEQSYTIFVLARFGCELAMWVFALWIRSAFWLLRVCSLACNRSTLLRTTWRIRPPADIRVTASSSRCSLPKPRAKMRRAPVPFP